MKRDNISAEELRDILHYDPDTGVFRWRIRRGKVGPGAVAGTHSRGYISIRIDGQGRMAHRLAWLYEHGVWPSEQIDHINGDRSDNRMSNLRDVDHATNTQNERRARRNNKSTGVLGVYVHKKSGRFVSFIGVNGRLKNLGYFDTVAEARAKYIDAKRLYHAGCTL